MLLSIKEAAGELSVGRDAVSRLMNNGELDYVEFPKMGGKGLYRKRMVEKASVEQFKLRHTKRRRGK